MLDHLCLNSIQRKTPCTACSDACPQNVLILLDDTTDWSACTNCNLCVVACPTSAINQSQASFDEVRRYVLEGKRPVSFSCSRAEEASDVQCACLAALPWDMLAAAALGPGLVLAVEHCSSCSYTTLVDQVKKRVGQLRAFLGKEAFSELVHTQRDPAAARDGQSKRISMANIGHTAQVGASKLFSESSKPTISCYRALLLEVLMRCTQERSARTLHWETLTEDGTCRGCEVCVKVCPHQALALHIPGIEAENSAVADTAVSQHPDQSQAQFLVHQADRCTQCGLCYVSCPTQGLGGWQRIGAMDAPVFSLLPLDVQICEKCKRPFKPHGNEHRCKACSRMRFQ